MNYTISNTRWSDSEADLRMIRTRVFIEEQSVPVELEWDGRDEQARHWLARDESGAPIGTLRMLSDGHIGRMAVLPEYRGHGVGRALLEAALAEARQQQLFEVYLYAQVQALAFYRQAGFIAFGEEFMDANMPHMTMRLQLAERRLLGVHGGNFSPLSFAETALELVAQTQQELRVLSYDLDPHTFGQHAMIEALSELARRSRHSDIRLLVIDTSKLIQTSHALLKLQRRLSSTIRIRRVKHQPQEIGENLIIADQCGVLSQSIREPDSLWANFNNRPVTKTTINRFQDLWERAEEDPALRQLEV